MKILITGGAGFIGSHLAARYLENGDEVFIIDNLSTGSLSNLKNLQENDKYKARLHVTIDDCLDYDVMLELVGICDVVVHLAAAVGVNYVIDNPLSSIVTNIKGTECILELCDKFKKKVLIASTSEVYGKHDHAPLVETDDSVFGPSTKSRWSYAAAKLMDEFTGLAYNYTKNLPVIVVRFFNTVGPRQTGRYGMVIPRFVKQALRGEEITVYGDGTQTRTFTHVEEVVTSVINLINCESAVGEVVNIGGVEEVSMHDLAEKIVELSKSKSTIKIIPYDEAYPKEFEDMQRRVPSTEKLRKLTGVAPEKELEEILIDVINFFKNETDGEFI